MAATLPPEVVEVIIANLEDDKAALRACAVVCSAWTSISQRCIFRTIEVEVPANREGPLLALHDCPHLRPLVINLEWVTAQLCSPNDVAFLFPRVRRLFYNSQIMQWAVLSRLPALEELEIGPFVIMTDQEMPKVPSIEVGSTPIAQLSISRLQVSSHRLIKALQCLHGIIRADVLRVLDLHIPYPAHVDMPWFREFLNSLLGLEQMRLQIIVKLKISDPDVGSPEYGASPLSFLKDQEFVPFVFGLLRSCSSLHLRSLCIGIDPRNLRRSCRENTALRAFDPMYTGGSSVHTGQEWTIGDELATQLERIDIMLPRIDALAHTKEFLGLFGAANRPGVLRVLPEDVRLL